jgi:hypothetical protein
MQIAHAHLPVEVGAQVGGEGDARGHTMAKTISATGYTHLPPETRSGAESALIFGNFWDTSGASIFKDCLFYT